MTQFLISVTVFEDRSLLSWSTVVEGEPTPVQWVGRAAAGTWGDVIGSILESDSVHVHVVDRRSAEVR